MKALKRVHKSLSFVFVATFIFHQLMSPVAVYAQSLTALNLPQPGAMLQQSPVFVPTMLKGMRVHPEDPFRFDFIIDSGNSPLKPKDLQAESERLIKYFLTSLTVPQDDLWVNLSPYEKTRVIPSALGQTEMGRDLLAQDYILKQFTASLIYPERDLGKVFWQKVYQQAYERFGTTNIPVNTFNKVWILPDKATVFENGDSVFVVESRLKVMMDEDYLAIEKNQNKSAGNQQSLKSDGHKDFSDLSTMVMREIVLPQIEKEVNEGQNFAPLRQIFQSLILAKWYRETLTSSVLTRTYVNRNKILGVDLADKQIKGQIYEQYVKAYQKGVFNFVKEEFDLAQQTQVPRKYFSGGIERLMNFPLGRTSNPSSLKGKVGGWFVAVVRAMQRTAGSNPPDENGYSLSATVSRIAVSIFERAKNRLRQPLLKPVVSAGFIGILLQPTISQATPSQDETADDQGPKVEAVQVFRINGRTIKNVDDEIKNQLMKLGKDDEFNRKVAVEDLNQIIWLLNNDSQAKKDAVQAILKAALTHPYELRPLIEGMRKDFFKTVENVDELLEFAQGFSSPDLELLKILYLTNQPPVLANVEALMIMEGLRNQTMQKDIAEVFNDPAVKDALKSLNGRTVAELLSAAKIISWVAMDETNGTSNPGQQLKELTEQLRLIELARWSTAIKLLVAQKDIKDIDFPRILEVDFGVLGKVLVEMPILMFDLDDEVALSLIKQQYPDRFSAINSALKEVKSWEEKLSEANAIEIFVKDLASNDFKVRYQALVLLKHFKSISLSPEQLAKIVAVIQSNNYWLQELSFGLLLHDSPGSLQALEGLATSQSAIIRDLAVDVLEQRGAVNQLAHLVGTSQSESTQRNAIQRLARMGKPALVSAAQDPQALERIILYFIDKRDDVWLAYLLEEDSIRPAVLRVLLSAKNDIVLSYFSQWMEVQPLGNDILSGLLSLGPNAFSVVANLYGKGKVTVQEILQFGSKAYPCLLHLLGLESVGGDVLKDILEHDQPPYAVLQQAVSDPVLRSKIIAGLVTLTETSWKKVLPYLFEDGVYRHFLVIDLVSHGESAFPFIQYLVENSTYRKEALLSLLILKETAYPQLIFLLKNDALRKSVVADLVSMVEDVNGFMAHLLQQEEWRGIILSDLAELGNAAIPLLKDLLGLPVGLDIIDGLADLGEKGSDLLLSLMKSDPQRVIDRLQATGKMTNGFILNVLAEGDLPLNLRQSCARKLKKMTGPEGDEFIQMLKKSYQEISEKGILATIAELNDITLLINTIAEQRLLKGETLFIKMLNDLSLSIDVRVLILHQIKYAAMFPTAVEQLKRFMRLEPTTKEGKWLRDEAEKAYYELHPEDFLHDRNPPIARRAAGILLDFSSQGNEIIERTGIAKPYTVALMLDMLVSAKSHYWEIGETLMNIFKFNGVPLEGDGSLENQKRFIDILISTLNLVKNLASEPEVGSKLLFVGIYEKYGDQSAGLNPEEIQKTIEKVGLGKWLQVQLKDTKPNLALRAVITETALHFLPQPSLLSEGDITALQSLTKPLASPNIFSIVDFLSTGKVPVHPVSPKKEEKGPSGSQPQLPTVGTPKGKEGGDKEDLEKKSPVPAPKNQDKPDDQPDNNLLPASNGDGRDDHLLLVTDQQISPATTGGVSLKNFEVKRQGTAVHFDMDPQQPYEMIIQGFDGLSPVFINFVPVSNPFPILGLADPQQKSSPLQISKLSSY